MTKLKMIVAMTSEGGIGLDNSLPWHIPAELAHFKRTTLNSTVIMGRTTYESIGKPLPDRANIVIANNRFRDYHENVEVVHSPREAVDAVQTDIAWVIGGGKIYHEFIDEVNEIVLTKIAGQHRCNRFFPRSRSWISDNFRQVYHESHPEFSVHHLERI